MHAIAAYIFTRLPAVKFFFISTVLINKMDGCMVSQRSLDEKALDGRIECSWNEKDLRIEKKCGFNKQFYFFEDLIDAYF
jgi:hypothetical protein